VVGCVWGILVNKFRLITYQSFLLIVNRAFRIYWFYRGSMNLSGLFRHEKKRRQALVSGVVIADPTRCVQCGICNFNCPINVDVRRHAWLGQAVSDSHCLTCGECIQRCPRGVLRFERTHLFSHEGKPPV